VLPQKKMFKVLAAIPKHGGGTFWMRCGSGSPNNDGRSINVYLDAVPKDLKFTLFEMDEEDFRKRDPNSRGGVAALTPSPNPQDVPF
jgi:hypothetical protein